MKLLLTFFYPFVLSMLIFFSPEMYALKKAFDIFDIAGTSTCNIAERLPVRDCHRPKDMLTGGLILFCILSLKVKTVESFARASLMLTFLESFGMESCQNVEACKSFQDCRVLDRESRPSYLHLWRFSSKVVENHWKLFLLGSPKRLSTCRRGHLVGTNILYVAPLSGCSTWAMRYMTPPCVADTQVTMAM